MYVDSFYQQLGVTLGPEESYELGQVSNPVDWIRGKLEEFYQLPAKIGAEKARARRLLEVARQKGNQDAAARLEDALVSLSETQRAWYATQGKISALMEALGAAGISLGVIPVAALALAAAAALAMIAVFAAFARQRSLISAVERGILTPEEAAKLAQKPALGISIPGLGKWLALGFVAYIAARRVFRIL